MFGNKKRFTALFVLLLLSLLAALAGSNSAPSQTAMAAAEGRKSKQTEPIFTVGGGPNPNAALPNSVLRYSYFARGDGIKSLKATMTLLPPQMKLLRTGSSPMWRLAAGKPTWQIGRLYDSANFGRWIKFRIHLRASARGKKEVCFKIGFIGKTAGTPIESGPFRICVRVKKATS